MATVKNSADLTTESNAVIGSQTVADTITPTTTEGLLEDMIISDWNKIDGITLGTAGVPLVIPALFTGDVNPTGTQLNSFAQKVMDKMNALAVLISGGIQGVAGEFLAMINPETNQIFERPSGGTANAQVAVIVFANDKDGGGFDNGNNFLVSKYKVPAGGFTANYCLSNFTIKLLKISIPNPQSNTITVGIYKNGVLLGSGASTTSPVLTVADVVGTIYSFDDIRVPVIPAVADVFTVEVWMSSSNAGSTCQIQVLSGFFYNQQ